MDKNNSFSDGKIENKVSWYVDFSEFNKDKINNIPNVIILGGIIVDSFSKAQLHSEIINIKASYDRDVSFPLKWCFKDLKDFYEKNNKMRLYTNLLEDCNLWRDRISQCLESIKFYFIVSIIKCHARYRNTLLKTKDMVLRFAFVMALQKYGLYVKNNYMSSAEVILDWPPGNKRQIFDIEFRNAFYFGKSADYNQQYNCGPLKDLGFNDSLLYANADECSMLQVSDLIVGAFNDLLKEAFGHKAKLHGTNFLRKIKNKLYGAPDNLNYGISISPEDYWDVNFSESIWGKIIEIFGA